MRFPLIFLVTSGGNPQFRLGDSEESGCWPEMWVRNWVNKVFYNIFYFLGWEVLSGFLEGVCMYVCSLRLMTLGSIYSPHDPSTLNVWIRGS